MVLVLDVHFCIQKFVERQVVVQRRAYHMRFDSASGLQDVK